MRNEQYLSAEGGQTLDTWQNTLLAAQPLVDALVPILGVLINQACWVLEMRDA